MFARTGRFLIAALVLLLSAPVASAQQSSQAPPFTQQELDQMLAPIALYPDSLLSQIMMAATYPREVVEAAEWSRRNADLSGDYAVRAVERYDWDPSVKSLVAFPQILDRLDEKMNWTQDLGDAFLDQQAQVMDTVQYLRRQAYEAGNLRSSDQFRVNVRDSSFLIDFVNPQVAYVPYYNPGVVYGSWWWPSHQPVYWAPWPGYYTRAAYRGFAWGPPIAVSRGFFYGAPDWHNRRVNIVNVNNYYYRSSYTFRTESTRTLVAGAPPVWQHDVAHRRDVPHRDAAWRQPAARSEGAADSRRDWRGAREAQGARPGNVWHPAVATPPAPAQPIAAAPPVVTGSAPNVTRGEPPGRGVEARGRESRRFEEREARASRHGDDRHAAVAIQPDARTAPTPLVAAIPHSTTPRSETPAHAAEQRAAAAPPAGAGAAPNMPRGEAQSRKFEARGERWQRQDSPFESHGAPERGSQPPSAAVPVARAPTAAPAAPAIIPARVAPAPMPVATPVPVAVNRPTVEARPAVAAAPRAPESRQAGAHDQGGHHASNEGNSRRRE